MKKIEKYFSKNVFFNSLIHALGGIGLGIILTHNFFDPHPLRWGGFFILASLAGHVYAYKSRK